jgi:hydroxyacylglutathione hydrolase
MNRLLCTSALLVTPLLAAPRASAQNAFPTWINGANCATEPKMQIFQYDPDTYILRQSMCTNYEGPFIYLIFGLDKVLMEDTGASASPALPIKRYVGRVIQSVLIARGQPSIELVVAHSHAHGDHVAYDSVIATLPNTTVVGTSATAVQSFFGLANWPTQTASYDLGGRIVDVIPIPGHQTAHIAFYDRATKWLLTGDTLYPGRLYISDFNAYKQSIQRLVDFTAVNDVSWVLGTHVEMQNVPGQQFPLGSTFHPNEHPLQLTRNHLLELLSGVLGMQSSPHIETHNDFIIYPF